MEVSMAPYVTIVKDTRLCTMLRFHERMITYLPLYYFLLANSHSVLQFIFLLLYATASSKKYCEILPPADGA